MYVPDPRYQICPSQPDFVPRIYERGGSPGRGLICIHLYDIDLEDQRLLVGQGGIASSTSKSWWTGFSVSISMRAITIVFILIFMA